MFSFTARLSSTSVSEANDKSCYISRVIKRLDSLQLTIGLSVLFIIAHFIAAMFLCRERLFLDSSYYFFHVVNEESFRVEHQRIILAVSQVLLLAGVKMHLSLSVLLILYSVTPVILTAVLVFVSLYFFRSESAALLIILSNVCGSYYLYYSPMYEVCYAVVIFGFLCLLTSRDYYMSRWQTLLYSSVLLICLFAYPLVVYGCIVLLIYHLVMAPRPSYRLILIYLSAFVIWLAIKTIFISDYEKGKISIPVREYPAVFTKIMSPDFIINALKFLWLYYKEPLIALIVFLVVMFKQKRYALGALAILSVSAFVGIVNFGYRGDGLIHSNNFERMYLLLVPLCFAPVLYIIYPGISRPLKILCVICVGMIAVYKSYGQWEHSRYYSSRIRSIDEMAAACTQRGCDKGAVDWGHLSHDLDEWSTGMEALIYSSEKGKSCIISDSAMVAKLKKGGLLDQDHFVLRLDEVMNINELNPHYFKLSRSPYCQISAH